jgi:hypothetical protein
MFLESIAGLSSAQWKFKPGPECWSIAEVAEHLLLAEESLFDEVTNDVMQTPAAPIEPVAGGKDERMVRATLDRGRKTKAPVYLQPLAAWNSPEALAAEFKKRRDRAIDYVRAAGEDLRKHSVPDPVFGSVNAYQCFLVLSGHTRRHIEQIREIRADHSFPEQ